MSPSKNKSSISKDVFAHYLTVEMEGLHDRAIHYDQMLAGKINFFLIIVTAFAGGLVLAASSNNLVGLSLPAACLVLTFLLMIGISTLRQCMDLAASVTTLYRRAGRIRRWFADQHLDSEKYLPFTVGDDRPQFNPNYALLRGMESILLLVNAVVAGALAGFLYTLVIYNFHPQFLAFAQTKYIGVALGLGALWAFIAWLIQLRYANQFMKRWEARQIKMGAIRFPSDSYSQIG
jgi:hypothetical protein